MKRAVFSATLIALLAATSAAAQSIDIPRRAESEAAPHIIKMGAAVNPHGERLEISSQSVLRNGKPWLPVMGEIHYARVPAEEWRAELQKMKDGGITLVATYVFWIHHEEIKGQFDWSGRRDLRRFLETCKTLDLPVVLRIGPWSHGEARNGGIPEWLAVSGIKLRQNNDAYLSLVRTWYAQIFAQARGLLWKDGGPVVGVQLENEYRGRWEHLATLKKMAVELGFDVPLYTRTGWPALTTPAVFGEIVPLYGDYPDGFWDRSLREMPGDYPKVYLFRSFRNSTVIATEQLPPQSGIDNPDDAAYPYFTCELGGGMMPSYHRRINIAPMDIYAMALVKVGSGSNLPGYYMYHGGTNPSSICERADTASCRYRYLNEVQRSPMTNHNDLPDKSYDFQAPLGEFGQRNGQYFLLKNLHTFLHTFGETLATMSPYFPTGAPTDARVDSVLRWCVRSNGTSGFIFVNNYQRLKPLSAKERVQFTINLPDEKLLIPAQPIAIPSGASFFIPFNLKLGNAVLKYATAQPVGCEVQDGIATYTFLKIDGLAPQFVWTKEDRNVRVKLVESAALEEKILADITPELVKKAGAPRRITIGRAMVAESPVDTDFDSAEVWRITIPPRVDLSRDIYLRMRYTGDVARLYCGDEFITDNFFNGKTFDVNLRYIAQTLRAASPNAALSLTLKILPLPPQAPIYFQSNVKADLTRRERLLDACSLYEQSVKSK